MLASSQRMLLISPHISPYLTLCREQEELLARGAAAISPPNQFKALCVVAESQNGIEEEGAE